MVPKLEDRHRTRSEFTETVNKERVITALAKSWAVPLLPIRFRVLLCHKLSPSPLRRPDHIHIRGFGASVNKTNFMIGLAGVFSRAFNLTLRRTVGRS